MISYYVNGENPITCSEKGWGRFKAKAKGNFKELGNAAIVRHTAKNNYWFGANSLILHKILRETSNRKVQVLLITLPVTEEYSAIMNEQQWNSTQREIYDVLSHFKNVDYIDLLRDKRFEKVDFYDPDHLNEIGVRKLMAVVNVWCEKNL